MVRLRYIAVLSVPDAFVSVSYERDTVRHGDIRLVSVRNRSYVRHDLIFLRGSRFLQRRVFALLKGSTSIGRQHASRQAAGLVHGKVR